MLRTSKFLFVFPFDRLSQITEPILSATFTVAGSEKKNRRWIASPFVRISLHNEGNELRERDREKGKRIFDGVESRVKKRMLPVPPKFLCSHPPESSSRAARIAKWGNIILPLKYLGIPERTRIRPYATPRFDLPAFFRGVRTTSTKSRMDEREKAEIRDGRWTRRDVSQR